MKTRFGKESVKAEPRALAGPCQLAPLRLCPTPRRPWTPQLPWSSFGKGSQQTCRGLIEVVGKRLLLIIIINNFNIFLFLYFLAGHFIVL